MMIEHIIAAKAIFQVKLRISVKEFITKWHAQAHNTANKQTLHYIFKLQNHILIK